MKLSEHSAAFILEELKSIHSTMDTDENPVRRILLLLELMFEELTLESQLHFPSLFSRIAFVSNMVQLDRALLSEIHDFRINARQAHSEKLLAQGFYVSATCLMICASSVHLDDISNLTRDYEPRQHLRDLDREYYRSLKGLVVDQNEEGDFNFIAEDFPEKKYLITYVTESDERDDSLSIFSKEVGLPVSVRFHDVTVEKNRLLFKSYVLEPDYLVDVTRIANLFKPEGVVSYSYILDKFLPVYSNKYLILGNIANNILDEVIVNGDQELDDMIREAFYTYPLQVTCLTDVELRDVLSRTKTHHQGIKRVVDNDMKRLDIDPRKVFLESSFYSPEYGLQGRLDLFHHDSSRNRIDIIELKSGKPFRPNSYGLSMSHYIQTLLYDLIVQSVYGYKVKPSNYILYSVLGAENLKFAPAIRKQQRQALVERNRTIVLERMLQSDRVSYVLKLLDDRNFDNLKGFSQRDFKLFRECYSTLSHLEKLYFDSFTSFIAREHWMAKIGEHGVERPNGLAGLWMESLQEKIDRFSIIAHLKIVQLGTPEDVSIITLRKTSETNSLNSFRIGDVIVLYPDQMDQRIFQDQVFKGSLLEQDDEQVIIRIRSRQYNAAFFNRYSRWNIEADLFDSSFLQGYRSLFEWAAASEEKRHKVLGILEPHSRPSIASDHQGLTREQNDIMDAMIAAEDYYLLWGPPGTGKTSVMLREYIRHTIEHTDQHICVVGYTNRAVDEICAAIESLGEEYEAAYMRVGSKYAVADRYRKNLLNHRLSSMGNRNEIRQSIADTRIIVSTLSSLLGKNELFRLKKFDTIIIDEASQILETQVVGLLSRFDKWIMIGDHKQLPAIVRQHKRYSQIVHQSLIDIGLLDRRNSLFERLYNVAVENGWTQAYGVLSMQGRMHRDLVKFPSGEFYNHRLGILASIPRLESQLERKGRDLLGNDRLIYIPSKVESRSNYKSNENEAEIVAKLIELILPTIAVEKTIGVITPFRSQIALIQQKLPQTDNEITVDTVERYQGGARDIIVISFCTNTFSQLKVISSHSDEGVDRKLNVALTRAREQIIFTGNREILSSSDVYARLIEQALIVDAEELFDT